MKSGMYAKTKYSEVNKNKAYANATNPQPRADWALGMLLANGYAIMNSFYINEIQKLIRSLRELGVEYTMKTIEGKQEYTNGEKKWKDFFYEFTTVYFEDDRE